MGETVLGLSASCRDAAAAVLIDGQIVAAAQEERFTWVKGESKFPDHAIRFCPLRAGPRASEALPYAEMSCDTAYSRRANGAVRYLIHWAIQSIARAA
jgi:predicted NodU family carbamoyl transferase